MCQGSRDYQERKDRVKAKVMARSLYCFVIIDRITHCAIVTAVKSILTGYKHPAMKYYPKEFIEI
jgi:hypothetical protein